MKKDKKQEIEFLNYISKNSEKIVLDIDSIITKVNNEKLERLFKNSRDEYLQIEKEAEDILKKYGADFEKVGMMTKVSTKVMSEVSLLKDTNDKNITKLIVENINKKIIEITEKINSYNNNDAEIVVLAGKLKATLEKNLDDLKKYL